VNGEWCDRGMSCSQGKRNGEERGGALWWEMEEREMGSADAIMPRLLLTVSTADISVSLPSAEVAHFTHES
jgi:hypothetical protein